MRERSNTFDDGSMRVRAFVVPVRPNRLLTPNVPHVELESLVLNSLHIETCISEIHVRTRIVLEATYVLGMNCHARKRDNWHHSRLVCVGVPCVGVIVVISSSLSFLIIVVFPLLSSPRIRIRACSHIHACRQYHENAGYAHERMSVIMPRVRARRCENFSVARYALYFARVHVSFMLEGNRTCPSFFFKFLSKFSKPCIQYVVQTKSIHTHARTHHCQSRPQLSPLHLFLFPAPPPFLPVTYTISLSLQTQNAPSYPRFLLRFQHSTQLLIINQSPALYSLLLLLRVHTHTHSSLSLSLCVSLSVVASLASL